MAGHKTLEALSSADAIADALDVARHERDRIDAHVLSRSNRGLADADDSGRRRTRRRRR
jgi:hypothetical protein